VSIVGGKIGVGNGVVLLIHNGNTFNYVLNLQGDVQQIRCAWTGEVVATYMYNAFGEIWGAEGRMARINPLLYRGYFLCSSLGMYYLQSRYYDPWIGRFINADAFVSTGQGFLGFNMFAYCLNNPVMLTDHTGYMACACGSGRVCTQNTGAQQSGITPGILQLHQQRNDIRTAQHAARNHAADNLERSWWLIQQYVKREITFGRLTLEQFHTDLRNADVWNTCPDVVRRSYLFAFYQGTPVIRTDRSSSFAHGGAIYLQRGRIRESLVAHEWGHIVQEVHFGFFGYLANVALPSLVSFTFNRSNHGSHPIERQADLWGGVYCVTGRRLIL